MEKTKIPQEVIDGITYQIKKKRDGDMFDHVEIDFQAMVRRETEALK
ncbi:MAG: hypothetical protein LBJ41_10045 [Treponema sp.]|jgi:hypothetical protein|nr:hypothetical protein [Treponema sp.]